LASPYAGPEFEGACRVPLLGLFNPAGFRISHVGDEKIGNGIRGTAEMCAHQFRCLFGLACSIGDQNRFVLPLRDFKTLENGETHAQVPLHHPTEVVDELQQAKFVTWQQERGVKFPVQREPSDRASRTRSVSNSLTDLSDSLGSLGETGTSGVGWNVFIALF